MGLRVEVRWSITCDYCRRPVAAGTGRRSRAELVSVVQLRRGSVGEGDRVTCYECLTYGIDPANLVRVGIGGRLGKTHRVGTDGISALCPSRAALVRIRDIPRAELAGIADRCEWCFPLREWRSRQPV